MNDLPSTFHILSPSVSSTCCFFLSGMSKNGCFLAWGFVFVFKLLCSFTKKKTGGVFPAFCHTTFHHALITCCNVSRSGYIWFKSRPRDQEWTNGSPCLVEWNSTNITFFLNHFTPPSKGELMPKTPYFFCFYHKCRNGGFAFSPGLTIHWTKKFLWRHRTSVRPSGLSRYR